jgi:hypothetical protein
MIDKTLFDDNNEAAFCELSCNSLCLRKQCHIANVNLLSYFSSEHHVTHFPILGCLATAGALSFGLWSFRRGEERMSQMMMRTRIVAQGFTVFALIIGVGFSLTDGMKEKTKE